MTDGNALTAWERPAIAFIVEGYGEYEAYPSFVTKIVGTHINAPRLNAQGYGGVVRNLEEHLADLTAAHHPWTIVATVDLNDVLDSGMYASCADLRTDLLRRGQQWLQENAGSPKYSPVPMRVDVVIQVPKFESWLIAHAEALHTASLVCLEVGDCMPDDVDACIRDPAEWLRARIRGYRPKDPKIAKRCAGVCDIGIVVQRSRSFSKFVRVVTSCYGSWFVESLAVQRV